MALFVSEILITLFTDTKYLGSTAVTYSLCSRPAVLHLNQLGVLDLNLFPALHTISLHSYLLFEDAMRLTRTHDCVNR